MLAPRQPFEKCARPICGRGGGRRMVKESAPGSSVYRESLWARRALSHRRLRVECWLEWFRGARMSTPEQPGRHSSQPFSYRALVPNPVCVRGAPRRALVARICCLPRLRDVREEGAFLSWSVFSGARHPDHRARFFAAGSTAVASDLWSVFLFASVALISFCFLSLHVANKNTVSGWK